MRIAFEGISGVVELPDCPRLFATLRAATGGWPFAETDSPDPPIAEVRATEGGYALRSPWAGTPGFVEVSAVQAVCSIVVDIVTAQIDRNPSRLCLHCGSAVIGGRLVVFPSRSRAGKSTLIGRLAADGLQIFGDDVLPLDATDGQGVALGLAPRLRLPLPPRAGPAFRRFVAQVAGPTDGRYQYLRLPGDRLAPRGTEAPLGAILLLDRREEGPAWIGPARRADALAALISQNFARAEGAGLLLDRLHRLMDRLPRFTLHYSDLDEAAALIGRSFASWPPRIDAVPDPRGAMPPRVAPPSATAASGQPVPPAGLRFRRHPAVTLRLVDGEAFLADGADAAIHHLNAIGTGLWTLLEDGIDLEEAVDVLHGAFPETDRDRIAGDVAALFAALEAGGFILAEAATAPAAAVG